MLYRQKLAYFQHREMAWHFILSTRQHVKDEYKNKHESLFVLMHVVKMISMSTKWQQLLKRRHHHCFYCPESSLKMKGERENSDMRENKCFFFFNLGWHQIFFLIFFSIQHILVVMMYKLFFFPMLWWCLVIIAMH